MSHEFIQDRLYKQTETTRLTSDDTVFVSDVDTSKISKGDNPHALFIPKPEDGMHYNKMLVECCVNLLFDCAQSLSKSIDRKKTSPEEYAANISGEPVNTQKRTTEHGIDIELTHQVREMAGLLQWIINSSSWREGKYFNFDQFEIERKLEMLKVFSRVGRGN